MKVVFRRADGAWSLSSRTFATKSALDDETPEAAVIRETREETGYQIRNPKLISQFFSSPGSTSERIFLYFVEVRDSDLVAKGGGIDEDVNVVHMSLDELFDRLADGALEDAKLLVAAYWLQD
jgi:nudix-type nucleoside diphosphatase (YffH/AdpP family)